MTSILLSTLDEGSGKTAIALALARLGTARGYDIGYMKPKGTRLQSRLGKTIDRDPLFAAELLDLADDPADMEPIVYSSTFVQGVLRGHEDAEALRQILREKHESLSADRDVLIVEGGGHLDVGSIIECSDPELADLFDANVILVCRYDRPEDVDSIIAAAMQFGERLEGVLFNALDDASIDSVNADVEPFLHRRGIDTMGVLPRERALAGVTVRQLASSLGADVLVEADDAPLVERFVIGAMGSEAAASHLRRARGAAVITGGDRSDIQSVAIDAPGVQCLVLTGGLQPSSAILGRAASAGVPVLLVGTDTRTTVDRAEAVVRSGRARDATTVKIMERLLRDHASVDKLFA